MSPGIVTPLKAWACVLRCDPPRVISRLVLLRVHIRGALFSLLWIYFIFPYFLSVCSCGAFGNPAGPVAACFREHLMSPEFRGAFAQVVFAVLDPLGTGNLGPFRRELGSDSNWRTHGTGTGTPSDGVSKTNRGRADDSLPKSQGNEAEQNETKQRQRKLVKNRSKSPTRSKGPHTQGIRNTNRGRSKQQRS